MVEKTGRGARKRLLPEREETWELGNGKGQGSPLPTHGFLSPPPPSANTWHGHKQGTLLFPTTRAGLGQRGKGQVQELAGLWQHSRARKTLPLGVAAGSILPSVMP